MQLYDESVEEYSQWRDELNSLCEQAEMSLQVMEIMNGLCSLCIFFCNTEYKLCFMLQSVWSMLWKMLGRRMPHGNK